MSMSFKRWYANQFASPEDVLIRYCAYAQQAAAGHGGILPADPVFDGEGHSMKPITGKDDGKLTYFAEWEQSRSDNTIWPTFTFNDYRSGNKPKKYSLRVPAWDEFQRFRHNPDSAAAPTLSSKELAERAEQAEQWRAEQEAKKAQHEQEQQAKRQKAADLARQIWNAETKPAPADNPYLERKQIKPVAFLKEIEAEAANQILGYVLKSDGQPLTGRLLVVPIQIEGKLSTLELIAANGAKTALAGGAKAGGYWRSETLPDGAGTGLTLLIGEGVATVLTAREATGNPVIAALTNSNLKAVAQQMRQKYPKAQIILLADLSKTDGKPDSKATEAAAEVGGLVAVPEVGDAWQTGLTDFNDMAQLKGIDAVAAAIVSGVSV